MTKKNSSAPEERRSFEDSFQVLKSIVAQLEGQQLDLEKSLTAFEEGMQAAAECENFLNQAEGRVESIMKAVAERKAQLTTKS